MPPPELTAPRASNPAALPSVGRGGLAATRRVHRPVRDRHRPGEAASRWPDVSGTRLNPNLTPLLDVVLQLITFFMMLIHFGTRLEGATRAVRLPVAPAALPGSDLALDRLPSCSTRGAACWSTTTRSKAPPRPAWWAEQATRRSPSRAGDDRPGPGTGSPERAADGRDRPGRPRRVVRHRPPDARRRPRRRASPISAWSFCGAPSR